MMRTSLAYTARALLAALVQHPDDLLQDQKRSLGAAARRLFEFAWDKEPRDGRFIMTVIEAVTQTFESDAAASSALLRKVIEPDRIATFGYEELPWLAEQVARLIPLDPDLVEDIYTAAFGHSETSSDTTSMGSGQILPLTSNRRQDYGMALFRLNLAFPEFLKQAPVNATRALISAVDAYASEEHTVLDPHEAQFRLGAITACIRDDHSFVWDATVYQDDEPMKLLRSFRAYLDQLAKDAEESETRAGILRVITERNCSAIIWKRLLTTGASHPNTLGLEIRELSWAVPVLANLDTTQAAGEFLRAVFGLLPTDQRERVEQAIVSVPSYLARESGTVIRDRLLGCLEVECLTTDAARRLVAALNKSGEAPANVPIFEIGQATWSEFTEEDDLQRQGVDTSAEANRRIRELASPVKEFAKRHTSDPPSPDEIQRLAPELESLHEALATAQTSGVDQRQQDYAWGHLAEACNKIVAAANLSCDTADLASVRALLCEASSYPDPAPHDEGSSGSFDKHPWWRSPCARVDAAQGLIRLARFPSCADSQVLEAISRLTTDAVPAVRLQVASELQLLHDSDRELMWSLVEQVTVQEESRGVFQFFVGQVLRRLSGRYPDRVAPLVKIILERMGGEVGSDEVRRQCISTLVGMYVVFNQSLAAEVLTEIADRPEQRSVEADWMAVSLRGYLGIGPVEPPDSDQDARRHRALTLLEHLLTSTLADYRLVRERLAAQAPTPSSPQDVNRANTITRLADSIAFQVFAASGALAEQQPTEQQPSPDDDRKLTLPEKRRFLVETAPLLDELAEFGFPHLDHELLETLESLVAADPADVFLRIAKVVRVGRQYGYQYEALAVGLIVRLVERYLADYRLVLRENDECRRALIDILDVFVEAGWPQARRLTYHLEDVFR